MNLAPQSFVVCVLLAFPAIAGSGIDQLPNGPGQLYGREPPPVYHRDDYGICIDRKQNNATRLDHCRTAMKTGRDSVKIQGAIGTIYNNAGQFDLAVVAFNQALATAPDDSLALNGRCRAQILAGQDLDAASRDCESAMRQDSDSAESLENQGLLQFRLNHADAALQSFNSAIRHSFKSPYAFFMRGVLKHRAGNIADGDSDIQTALALDPGIKTALAACGILP